MELIALYREKGDMDIIGALYRRYVHLVFGICMKYLKDRETGKDAVMQIFEKLISDLENHEVQNFKSWLYVLSKNHCLMQLRKQKKESDFPNLLMENYSEPHLNDKVKLEDNLIRLEECISKLKDEQKECVELFYLKQHSYEQIVSKTHYPLKKVKSYIQNGKRNLKQCLEHE